jgi:hypothetical protein
MVLTLKIVTMLLLSVAMALALAHALEAPGKRRLDLQTYRAVQQIYYPGFTYAGVSEPLAIVALLALAVARSAERAQFLLVVISLMCVVAMHAVYWVFTHPINRLWLERVEIGGLSERFFGRDLAKNHAYGDDEQWRRLRSRWERSHVARAALGLAAFVSLLVSVAR